MSVWRTRAIVAGLLAVAAGGVVAWRGVIRRGVDRDRGHDHEVIVHDVGALPKLDGELDDAIWQRASRTGAFVDDRGAPARPFSEARFAWTDGHLVLALYAADEDIRTKGEAADAFQVTLGTVTFEATPTGELRGAPAGTGIGHDADGTLDDPSNDDEEWVLELSIPLAGLGLGGRAGERIPFEARRCDTGHDGVRRCGYARALLLLER